MQKFPGLVILQTTLQKVTLLNRLNRVEFAFADSFPRARNSRMDTLRREKGNEREGNSAMSPFILAEATAKPTRVKYATN